MLSSLVFASLAAAAGAQAPAGYYNGALGLNGAPLQSALHSRIANHTVLTYTPGLWDAYYTTDVKPNTNKLWTIYSDKPGTTPPYEFVIGTSQCSGSNPSSEGGCYNREHLWPRTYFGGQVPPMNTDLWIVYPTDYWVNSKRGDLPYGKTGSTVTFTSQNGSKIGANVYPGAPSGNCFEPIDSFKGDIARSYFYVATRYLGEDAGWSDWAAAAKAVLKPWAVQMFLEWHHLDPVSEKEQLRNNAVYNQQANRNPFIDYPQFADCIWGSGDCSKLAAASVSFQSAGIRLQPNPAVNEVVINWESLAPAEVLAIDVLGADGRTIYHNARPSGSRLLLETSAWPKGLYFVKMQTERGVKAEQLLVR